MRSRAVNRLVKKTTATDSMKRRRAFGRIACALAMLALLGGAGEAAASHTFGVLGQRSAVLTAAYWNPILAWVSAKSGVALELKIARPGSGAIRRGEYDFVYTNHNFLPGNEPAGYRVILKPRGEGIRGEIVVPEDSPVKSLAGLAGREVAFPSRSAFVGYAVTMQGLAQAGVKVEPVFAANQEGAMAQMRAGRVTAASVNSQLMRDYAEREKLRYRVLWRSEAYPDLPISVHPRVSAREAAAVREAFAAMAHDTEGARILAASAALVKEQPPYGFEASDDAEYAGVRAVYRGAAK
ncbi:MAG: hypothetical protein OHK0026_14590 [Rhodocyclaceae bacterium]